MVNWNYGTEAALFISVRTLKRTISYQSEILYQSDLGPPSFLDAPSRLPGPSCPRCPFSPQFCRFLTRLSHKSSDSFDLFVSVGTGYWVLGTGYSLLFGFRYLLNNVN